MTWKHITHELPPTGEEVLVLVDGHRGPSWSNTYCLVAYKANNGSFYEERHNEEPVQGVIGWQPLPENPANKWNWMMDYCKRYGFAPANETFWKRAEEAYNKTFGKE